MSANSALNSLASTDAATVVRRATKSIVAVSGTALLTLVAVAISIAPQLAEACQMNRGAVFSGGWWQIVTCHFTHWNLDHLFWDAIVFAGLGALCERRHRLSWTICVCGSAIAIPLGLLALCPEMMTYRGLSGLDSAIFALFIVHSLKDSRRQSDRTGVLIYSATSLGFAAKLGFESMTGSTFFVNSSAAGFVPIVEAHVLGAAIGAVVGLCLWERDALQ